MYIGLATERFLLQQVLFILGNSPGLRVKFFPCVCSDFPVA